MPRVRRTVVALALGALAACLGPADSSDGSSFVGGSFLGGVAEARADGSPITVGTSLLAVSDVTLRQAAIRKGSRVVVTGVRDSHGRTVVDLELPDGYVLRRIMMSSIRESFRVVG